MKKMLAVCLLALLVGVLAPSALATPLPGTVLTAPASTALPGLVAPGTLAGTLLASLVTPYSFTTTTGTTSGTVTSAVYRNSSGTLDFYYQVSNNASSKTSIARESNVSFLGFTTWTGFRTDAVGPFVAGSIAPLTADRDSLGSVLGFSFNPPTSTEILPGQTSDILVISTDATGFTAGNAEVLDGGSVTVASFQPAAPAAVPEPSSLMLLGTGALGLLGALRRKLLG